MVVAARGKNVWLVGGGELVGEFADQGLLDEIILGIAPVTLGSGAPLLPRRLTSENLALAQVAQMGQFAYLTYAVGSLAQFGRHKTADVLHREPAHT
jgi:dihydrofolate reductase